MKEEVYWQHNSRYIHNSLMLWAFLPHLFIYFLFISPFYEGEHFKIGMGILLIIAFLVLLESYNAMLILYRNFSKIKKYHPIMVVVTTLYVLGLYLPFEENVFLKGSLFLLCVPFFIGTLVITGQLANDDVIKEFTLLTEKT